MDRLLKILISALVALIVATVMAPQTFAQPMRSTAADSSAVTHIDLALRTLLARQPAQIGQLATPTTASPTPQPTRTPAATEVPLPAATVTSTQTITAQVVQTEAAQPAQTTGSQITVVSPDATPSAPLEGTIIANRSEDNARFFVEGSTYDLAPGRSIGLLLPRTGSVLNLYNCDSGTPENQGTCFWDPYLITLNGFYEVYNAPDTAVEARLLLREAGLPPTDQVWVQNRTTQTEQVVYKNETYDVAPTTVREFAVTSGVPAILYVRSCLTLSGQTVCEWAPKTLDAGIYYAMVGVDTAGAQPGSQITTLDLRPVVGGVTSAPVAAAPEASATSEAPAQGATATPAPLQGQITCRLLVPTLNVRSGPGLYYEIIDKVRDGDQPATVAVDGRSVDGEWLTVNSDSAAEGWITASSSFVTCDGDIMGLPMVEAPAPPPTPDPAVITQEPALDPSIPAPEAPAEAPASDQPAAAETPTPATDLPAPPAGQALLIVTNGFQHDIRFTLDQRYRPEAGPSEYDLTPGASVSVVVYPGQVDFSASSAWNNLSGNATLALEADQSLPLWLRFEPDGAGSSEWRLAWQ